MASIDDVERNLLARIAAVTAEYRAAAQPIMDKLAEIEAIRFRPPIVIRMLTVGDEPDIAADLEWLRTRFIYLSESYGDDRNTRPEHDEVDARERERARAIIADVKRRLGLIP